jgi:hypothetical protein
MTYTKPFISVNKIAAILKIHHVTTSQFLETLDIKPVIIGRRRLFRSCEVLPLLDQLLGNV